MNAPVPLDVSADQIEGDREWVRLNGRSTLRTDGGEIRADRLAANSRSHDVSAEGSVRVVDGERHLESDTARGNLSTKQLTLDGHVVSRSREPLRDRHDVIRLAPVTLRAAHAEYDLARHSGRFLDLQTDTLSLRIEGKSGVLNSDGTAQIEDARLSACNDERPGAYSYHLEARSMKVIPEQGADAENASLFIGHRRIFRLKRVKIRSSAGGGAATDALLPSIGSTPQAGSYLTWTLHPVLVKSLNVSTRLDLTTRLGPRTFTTLRMDRGAVSPFVRVYTGEEEPGRNPKRLLIDRLPEVGVVLDSSSRGKLSRWVQGDASFGFIHQHYPRIRRGRAQFTLTAQPLPLRQWGEWQLNALPSVHMASYTTGESYQDLTPAVQLMRRWNDRNGVDISYARHFTHGITPFLFDEALVKNELSTDFRWSLGKWAFGARTRMDLRRTALFDGKFSIGRAIHCIEPRLAYYYRLRALTLEVNLVGLGTLEDLPAAPVQTPRPKRGTRRRKSSLPPTPSPAPPVSSPSTPGKSPESIPNPSSTPGLAVGLPIVPLLPANGNGDRRLESLRQ